MSHTILIVDDDPVQRRLLEAMISRLGMSVLQADGGEAALKALATTPRIDLIILDLVMPDLDGMGVLARLREQGLNIPVIVQTAHGGIDTVVSAMRAGAADFVVKPVGAERLHVSIQNALKLRAMESEIRRLSRVQAGTLSFKDIITRAPRMQSVLKMAEKAATSQIPVLIEGESGVGKEMIARAIHGTGNRRAKPFVAVNCGAIPDTLVESILFGHEKGAFTGATERHIGKFVEADGGTLFLDEVGELPPAVQVKLLRAIQEGEVDPVGGRKSVKVDIRIMSATNRLLLEEVQQGRFREDLYYRLGVFPITIPPLRERMEDIPDLVRHFLARFTAEEGRRIRAISGSAMQLLQQFRWPGNVRQLENAVFRAVVLAETDELQRDEFPQIMASHGQPLAPPDHEHPEALPLLTEAPPLMMHDPVPHTPPAIPLRPATSTQGPGILSLLTETGDVHSMEHIEREAIRFALSHYRNQMTEVARQLKIGRSTLYRKLKDLGLEEGLVQEAGES